MGMSACQVLLFFLEEITNENTLGNPLESKGELSSEQAKFGSTSYKLNDQSITYDGEGALTEGEFTLSFWAYSDSDSTRNNSYAYLSSTGNICLYLNGKFTLGWDYNQYEPTTAPTLNNGWNFYVLEFTQKYMNGQIRVYVNGTKIFDKTMQILYNYTGFHPNLQEVFTDSEEETKNDPKYGHHL